MDDLNSCLIAAVADGHMSQKAADEFAKRHDEILADLDQSISWSERQRRAAQRIQDEIERKLRRNRRMKVKQALKAEDHRQRLAEASGTDKAKAARAILDFDKSLAFSGENVAMRHQAARGQAFALMADFLDRFRSKAGGLKADKAGMADVVKGLFGEKTTDTAKAFADAIQAARGMLRGRFNVAGGDLLERKDWGWVQKHDAVRIKEAGLEAWRDFVLPRLDPKKMYNAAGLHMTDKELSEAVDAAYETLVTGDLEGMTGAFNSVHGSPVNARVAGRELGFRDSAAWLEYQQRFGDPDIFGSIIGEIDRLARDVAVIEVLGPYPRAALAEMKKAVEADGGAKGLKNSLVSLDSLFDEVTGRANPYAQSGFARAMQTNRNLLTAARLGSSIFLALFSDSGTASVTAKMAGIPQARLFGRWLKQLSPANAADRRLAARAGFVAETWLGQGIAAQRMMGEVTGSGLSGAIADTSLRLSGLSAWSDGGRAAFGLEFLGHMTDQADRAFSEVEPALLATMRRHGITAEHWDLFRSTSVWRDPETGAEFIRPEDTYLEVSDMMAGALKAGEKEARFQTANRIAEMIHAESYYAIVRPTATSRALVRFGAERGSFLDQMLKNATLWKSFGVSFMHLHLSRMMAQQGIFAKGLYGAAVFVPMTLSGAMAIQASNIARGKDPQDMSTAAFWLSAVQRGGALGPGMDLLFSSVSRHGQSWLEELAGPVVGGEVGALVSILRGGKTLLGDGESVSLGTNIRRTVDLITPGGSLWYARLAYERLIGDQVQAALDPGANDRFRRIERQAKRDNQKYWWKPGKPKPDRPPRLGAATEELPHIGF